MDYALRRRFAFITLHPSFGNSFRIFLKEKNLSEVLTDHIISSVEKVNAVIRNDVNLGEGFQIGHSYFCTCPDDMDEDTWYSEVLDFEIKPLLEEIMFDDPDKVESLMNILRR